LSFADGDPPRRVWLTDPQGRRSALEVVRFAQQAEIRTAGTNSIGEYRLDVEEAGKSPYSLFYVVSAPQAESDLRQLSDARWTWLEQNLAIRRIEPAEQPLRDIAMAGRSDSELWLPLLVIVLLLGMLEMVVSRWSCGARSA
jgi:hypothetical protein